MAAIIRRNYTWKSFNIKPVSGFDNAAGLQDVAECGQTIFLPPETFEVGSTVNWGFRGADIRGTAQFNNSRATNDATFENAVTADKPTRIKYVGSSGTDTAVVKVAVPAVGTPFSSADVSTGDDLFDVNIQNILFDANNLADYGVYIYRAGNGSYFENIGGARSAKIGVLMAAMFSGRAHGVFAMRNKRVGVAIGHNPYADTASVSYSQFEWTVNAFRLDSVHAFANGLDETWDEATNPYEGSIIFCPGRDCLFTNISCEGNDNPMVIMPTRRTLYPASGSYFANSSSNLCFNNTIKGLYLENNCDDAVADTRATRPYGLIVKNDPYGGGLTIEDVFQHPGSSLPEQNIKVVSVDATATSLTATNDNQGSTDYARQLIFRRVGPGGDIYSNTTRFRVEEVDAAVTYPDETPNTGSPGQIVQTTAADAITISNEAGTPVTSATGRTMSSTTLGSLTHLSLGGAAMTGASQATFGSGTATSDQLLLTGLSKVASGNGAVFPIKVFTGGASGVADNQIWGRIVSGSSNITLYKDAAGAVRLKAGDLHASTNLWIEINAVIKTA